MLQHIAEQVTMPRVWLLFSALQTTLAVTFLGLCIGLVGGLLFGIASSRRMAVPGFSQFIAVYGYVMQGTPLFVQVLIMYFAIPLLWGGNISAFAAGVIAVGLNSIAYVTHIIRSGINSIGAGQWEAAYVLGYSRMATLYYIIIPQMVRVTLPALMNEIISLVKETSILGTIGVLELTKVGRDLVSRTMEPFVWYVIVAILYLLITSTFRVLAHVVEKRFEYDNH